MGQLKAEETSLASDARALYTPTLPPSLSTMRRTMVRPRPYPSVRTWSSQVKGVNSTACCSEVRPSPLSRTQKRTVPSGWTVAPRSARGVRLPPLSALQRFSSSRRAFDKIQVQMTGSSAQRTGCIMVNSWRNGCRTCSTCSPDTSRSERSSASPGIGGQTHPRAEPWRPRWLARSD